MRQFECDATYVCDAEFYFHRNMVDMKSIGKLNAEQFAVAMFLISEKVNGNRLRTYLQEALEVSTYV